MVEIIDSKDIRFVQFAVLERHTDERGGMAEFYRRGWFTLGREMIQANMTHRAGGSLVGLHYHLHQADYWFIVRGRARIVLYDLRLDSPTVGSVSCFDLTSFEDMSSRPTGVFIPPGVAHGFAAFEDTALMYLVDNFYNPTDELGLRYDDPAVSADWSVIDPIVSQRDLTNPLLAQIPDALRPTIGQRSVLGPDRGASAASSATSSRASAPRESVVFD